MPSIVRMPKFTFGSNPVDNLPGLGGPVKSGVKAVGGFADDALRGGRSLFSRSPRKAPRVPGVQANPVQAGDDAVRAVTDNTPSLPAAGRSGSRQFPTAFVVKAGSYSALGYGGYRLLTSPQYQTADPLAPVNNSVKGAGEATGDALTSVGGGLAAAFGDLGVGLANLLAGAGLGAGAGAGGAIAQTGQGVGEAIKAVALPALLVGAGFLVFTALKK